MPSRPLPHDICHSYIIPELILEHLHSVLIEDVHLDWNAFFVLPLVCAAFNVSTRSLYRRIFGIEDDSSLCNSIRPIYSRARNLWISAKHPVDDPDALPETRYRELMANESLIQVYICLALSRQFLGVDVLKPLSCRQGTNHQSRELLRRKGLGLEEALPELANSDLPCKMKDDKMYRLFLPLTCAGKLCDTIRPEKLAYRVVNYIAEILPWYTILPVLLKYVQDIDSFVEKEYAVSQEVYNGWTLQTLLLIDKIDDFMQQFQNVGRLVNSATNFSEIPREIYEVINLRLVLEQVIQCDWAPSTAEIHTRARAVLVKLNDLNIAPLSAAGFNKTI